MTDSTPDHIRAGWCRRELSDFSWGVGLAEMGELVFCLPEKKWVSIFVHWAHLAAYGHLGTWYLPSWSVPVQLECPVQLDCPCTADPYEPAPPHCHSVLVSRSDRSRLP